MDCSVLMNPATSTNVGVAVGRDREVHALCVGCCKS